ncbi:hypothetical protein QN277_022386 [Acacia crassicarpa]|uniref:CCHC-type domain-containing protein n=1 Tax=Acacia crassicarpa TaxID=499986 RepID=A0AAE1MPK1_9FABA|nr:hypothetical protein QN277_022386 [Acacia crassicarpa]
MAGTLQLSRSETVALPPSTEEEDLLVRSSKKIKNGHPTEMDDQWPKLGNIVPSPAKGAVSFADKLKGITLTPGNGVEGDAEGTKDDLSDDSMSDNDSEQLCKVIEDPKRNFPKFIFSGKMKKRMYKAWSNSVIITLLGRSIGYKALENRLQSLWAKRGVIKLINIGHGYYVVKFSNKEDSTNALTGGPWLRYDHYLVVRQWEPMFNSATAKVDKVAVWVRLPRIFLEYYDKEALAFIGDRIGETVKVDINTSCQLRGHYARLCVLVDLTKQLMSGFSVDGEDYFVEYEGLHMLCSNCGIYGHRHEQCPQRKTQHEQAEQSKNASDNPKNNTVAAQPAFDNSGDYWKVVQKVRRPRKNKDKQSTIPADHSANHPAGSRFSLLAVAECGDQQITNGVSHENPDLSATIVVRTKEAHNLLGRGIKGKKAGTENVTQYISVERPVREVMENQEKQPMGLRRVDKRARVGVEGNMHDSSGELSVKKGDEMTNVPMDATEGDSFHEKAQPDNALNIQAKPYDPGEVDPISPDSGQLNDGLVIESPMLEEVSDSIQSHGLLVAETQMSV